MLLILILRRITLKGGGKSKCLKRTKKTHNEIFNEKLKGEAVPWVIIIKITHINIAYQGDHLSIYTLTIYIYHVIQTYNT